MDSIIVALQELIPYTSISYTVATHSKSKKKQTGFLYGALPVWMTAEGNNAEYARGIWDRSPGEALTRAKWLNSYALAVVKKIKNDGGTLPPTGDNDEGPDLFELAEDYAQDAAVAYLAAAIPGGVVVLAVADQLGIGWTNTSGRQEFSAGGTCPNNRWRTTMAADELIAYAYANPAPAVIGTATVSS